VTVPLVSIIIVSFNTKDLTIQAIQSVFESLQHLQQSEIEVIVVDNNSHDDSVPSLKKEFGTKIKLIANKENSGFGKANNQGVLEARGKYILFLNSDTIVRLGAIDRMVESLKENLSYGIISCRLLYSDGSYQPQGGALPTLLNITSWWLWPFPGQLHIVPPYQDTRLIEKSSLLIKRGWVGGTAMMIPKTVLEEIGSFDENIFMYAEDIELCMRAKKAGYTIGIVPNAEIVHIGSASSDSTRAKLGEIKGLLYISSRYFSRVEQLLLRFIFWKGSLLRYLLFGILKGSESSRRLYGEILHLV
jgi:GT2 family glycosyltransferase